MGKMKYCIPQGLFECVEYVIELEHDIEASKKECKHSECARERVQEFRDRQQVAKSCIRE